MIAKYDRPHGAEGRFRPPARRLKSFNVRQQSTLIAFKGKDGDGPFCRRHQQSPIDRGADQHHAAVDVEDNAHASRQRYICFPRRHSLDALPLRTAAAPDHPRRPPSSDTGSRRWRSLSDSPLSFVAVGMFIATIGYGIGLDPGFFRITRRT